MSESDARAYDAKSVQQSVWADWEHARAFHAVPEPGRQPFAIVIPPPNVTAALHMGHALNNTLQDVLVRWRRMAGDNAVWIPGTDHAGIATQTVVDKRLQQEGEPALKDYKKIEAEGGGGREQFIGKVQAWKDEYERRITEQLKAMGCSCDWDRQRFTMDEVCAAAVREAFFRLFKEGLIYRGKRLVNWDPATQTALADDEVEMREIDGHFWYMKYPVVEPSPQPSPSEGEGAWQDTGAFVTVATTRPETMLGDTAVAVNPRDEKNAHLIGQSVRLPIVNRVIPIVGDDHVVIADPESDDVKAKFASGFLKVTPAHDPNDWEIGQRHGLAVINVMAPDGSISREHGWPAEEWADGERLVDDFADELLGMDRYEAREAIVDWFREHDLLAEVRPYSHSVGHSYRSHVPVEPYLSDQWYVKVTDDRLAGAALRAMAEDQRSGAASRDREGAVGAASEACDQTSGTGVSPVIGRHGRSAPSHSITQRLSQHRRSLPHWQAGGSTYFVTFRLLGGELEDHERELVLDACLHWHGKRADVHLVTVMPDHVHMVIQPLPENKVGDDPAQWHWYSLSDLMHSIKSYSAHQINEARGSAGALWQSEFFDRIIRDEKEYEEKTNYMWNNPVKAGLAKTPEGYPFTASGWEIGDTGSAVPADDGRDARPTGSWEGGLRFYPERYAKTFQAWHENIRDWCISRQLWWGHRIPVWSKPGPRPIEPENFNDIDYALDSIPELNQEKHLREDLKGKLAAQIQVHSDATSTIFFCVKPAHPEIETLMDSIGFDRDPDVLDTWFSSALWPISTLGWPDPDAFAEAFAGDPSPGAALEQWNPSSTLCTAREIITLWVSRMVMFNLFFRDCLPFKDVFIHAMIQDGEGQKMSKSLGNGVDPLDIIDSHGADAMRFVLAKMTTQTQDVKMPVDVVCPHTGETFEPKMVTTPAGHRVAAPIQPCPSDPSKKMVTSYGYSSGQAKPTEQMPLARNTSTKFDEGRNFANKVWNAGRFVMSKLRQTPGEEAAASLPAGEAAGGSLADRWILSRLARTISSVDQALGAYQFNAYAQGLYDFIWRDYCDWYLEAIKPVVDSDDAAGQAAREVAAAVLDAILRLLQPVMPFVSEKMWQQLNAVQALRAVPGLTLEPAEQCMTARWPMAEPNVVDASAERGFELVREVVVAIRNVRNQYNVPPRQRLPVSVRAEGDAVAVLSDNEQLLAALAGAELGEVGPAVEAAGDAATTLVGEIEVYVEGLVDPAAERERLSKRLEELGKSRKALSGRLNNPGYVQKAPPNLVQQTRDQLAEVEREIAAIEAKLASL